jgi:aldose 1-epimerase
MSQRLEKEFYGKTSSGETVDRYTLCNGNGMTARIINYGATVTEILVPDRQGKTADVVLGFDDLASYEKHRSYFGCMVGRVAFRIYQGRFTLDGKQYQLDCREGNLHLHGGPCGFSLRVWKAETIDLDGRPAVKLSFTSPDGDQGYPGVMQATTIYSLTDDNALRIDSTATTDRPTLVNLTNHSYFNLAGASSGDILNHVARFDADRYTPSLTLDQPTGEIVSVAGTPLDFTKPMPIGARIDQTDGELKGYDHCFVRKQPPGEMVRVAEVCDPNSGRVLEVVTSEPSFVFYTTNGVDGLPLGKGGVRYPLHAALCLETGRPPNAVNCPQFPSIVLRHGETYRHVCEYRFSTR